MNKIKAIIIEDEIPAARLLCSMVREQRPAWDVEVVSGSVEQALEWLADNTMPDLIFLDIQLSDGNSFELLSKGKPSSAIIFTTAYDEYAVRAFSVNSIDYILKPFDNQRLTQAIVKYENLGLNKQPNYLDNILDALSSTTKRYRTRFLISGHDSFRTLSVESIAYFYCENKITYAVLHTGEQCMVDFSLDKLIKELDPDRFFKANRQTIIGIDSIKRIEPYFNGKAVVSLAPASREKVTISRERISDFKLWLNY